MIDKRIGYIILEGNNCEQEATSTIISEKGNRVIIETILQDMNIKNRNGRYYSSSDLIPEFTSPRTLELLGADSFFGEAGHPQTVDLSRQQTIDPNNISHQIMKIWPDKNNVMGIVKGTPNNIGDNFNKFILDGTKPAFSLRALGTVENTARGAEVKNIKIIGYDWVIFPSHRAAYMQKIVSESTNIDQARKVLIENEDGRLIPITNQSVINYIKTESCNLHSIIESFDILYNSIELLETNKVKLVDKEGSILVINLENHIQNEIMNYCNNY